MAATIEVPTTETLVDEPEARLPRIAAVACVAAGGAPTVVGEMGDVLARLPPQAAKVPASAAISAMCACLPCLVIAIPNPLYDLLAGGA
jgi:hypothetical protein